METPIVFGELDNLVGVVTEPNDQHQEAEVAIVMLTAGMLHHVGPHRMYVQLARRFSTMGFLSFRFDLSGIGESLAVGSSGTSLERAATETKAAMDAIQREYGIKKFVLLGLCSGADDSMHTALQDDRVVGAVMLDGCGYRTKNFNLHRIRRHVLPRLMNKDKVVGLVKRGFRKASTEDANAPTTLQLADDVREFPDRDQSAKDIQQLVDRGVKLRFIYTGGVHEYYNYANQFEEMFSDVDFKGNATSSFYPNMDHLAMLTEDRAQLFNDLSIWFEEHFPQTASAAV